MITKIKIAVIMLVVPILITVETNQLPAQDQAVPLKPKQTESQMINPQTIAGSISREEKRGTINFLTLSQETPDAIQTQEPISTPLMPLPITEPVLTNAALTKERQLSAEEVHTATIFAQSSPWLSASFAALGDDNTRIPPDVQGAAGPNHLMTTLNSQVRIQNRSGTTMSTVSLQTFWSSVGPFSTGTGVFDPRVLYDPYSNRWIHVACADPRHNNSSLVIGVSQSNDPTGTWNLFRIDVDATNALWADYPTIGFNKKWIVVQVNMYPNPTGNFSQSNIYVFNKDSLYANTSAKHTLIVNTDGYATQAPAVTFSSTQDTVFLVSSVNGNFGGLGYLRLYTVTGAVGSEILTLGTFITTPNTWDYSGGLTWSDYAPQLGTSNKIMNNDDRMQNVIYRNGYLWCTHTVFLPTGGSGSSGGRSAVQWWQLTTNGAIVQRGRIDDATAVQFFAFPSICVNKYNDVMIGYSRFSASQYASANYSFRSAADPINTIRSDTVYKAGEASYYKTFSGTTNRWGDFSHTVIDPTDDIGMWTIQQYAATPSGGSDRWGTWWGQLQANAVFIANPSSMGFGTVLSGGSKTDSLFVVNTGSGTLIIDSVRSDNTQFIFSPGGATVAPLDSQKYTITFTPTGVGVINANIIYYHNGSSSPDTVAVTGATIPSITSFVPSSGMVGTSVTINGAGFDPVPLNNVIYFGGAKATVTASSPASLTIAVPAGAIYGPISVTVNGLTGASTGFFSTIFTTGSGTIDTASFMGKVDHATGNTPWGIGVADIDLDGKIDVAVVNSSTASNSVSIFRNTSVGSTISFAPRLDLFVNDTPRNLAFGDIDGDGKLDLAVTRQSSNSVSIFRNLSTPGSVSFASRLDFTVGTGPFDVAIGEIDGDGKPDVACANGSAFTILRNTSTIGSISFAAKVDITSGNGTRSIALGDFDGDGMYDVTVISITNSTMSVFRNISTSGNVSFASAVTYTTGTAPYEVVVGDIDTDGKLDITSVNYTSANVSVFRSTCTLGNISFDAALNFATGNGPSCLISENLNGDIKPDIFVANYIDTTASVLQNTSASISFAAHADYPTGNTPYGSFSGDLDGDGAPDILTTNQIDNTMSVLRNRLADSYIITASVVGSGSINPSGSVSVLHGANQTFTFAPGTGYHFDSLVVDGVKVDSLISYTFYNVTYAHTITAYFTINQYTITAQNVGNGTISPSGSVVVTHGSDQPFVISPNANYHIDSVVVDGVDQGPVSDYDFLNVQTNHTITVYFSIDTYNIVATVTGDGWILPSGIVIIAHGSDQKFTFGPNPNAMFDSLFVDDVFVDSSTSYTFYNVTQNHTIRAKFVPTSNTITIIQSDHGTIVPGTTDVPFGGSQTFAITPDVGYHVDSVFVDDIYVPDSLTSYTFINVMVNHTMTAKFAINTYVLTIDVVGSGSVTRDPDLVLYDHGASVNLEAVPADDSWEFTEWSGDLTGSDNPASIIMDGPKSVTATFEQNPAYLVSYRSFIVDSIAFDTDKKGKVGKYEKRKVDKVDFEFYVVNPFILTAPDLHVEFGYAIDSLNFPFGTIPPSVATNPDGKMKKWDFAFPTLNTGDTVWIYGYGNKGNAQKVSKYYWTDGGLLFGEKLKIVTFTRNITKMPMPNRINALYETFLYSGYGVSGMVVGQARTDSNKYFGWFQTLKYSDVWKSLNKKGLLHTGSPHGFDYFVSTKPVVKQQKKLEPTKYNNMLFASLVALKFNITASAMGINPVGFGELIYDEPSTAGPFDGMMIKDIAAYADEIMMGWLIDTVDSRGRPTKGHLFLDASAPGSFNDLNYAVGRINSAFEGELDTMKFSDSLKFTGVRALLDVPYLRANDDVIPTIITPMAEIIPQEPVGYSLYQNYPNPFNPMTTIEFDLPTEAFVTLKIYNTLGQEVATLLDNELMSDGTQELEYDASHLASGVYFYRLNAGGYYEIKKMLFLK